MSLVFRVLFQGDTTNLDAAFRRAANAAEKWGDSVAKSVSNRFASLFAADRIISAIESAAKEGLKFAADIKDAADQTKTTTDEVQRLTLAAAAVGLTFDDVASAMSNLGRARKEAALSDGEARDQLKRYGVSLEDVQNPLKSNLDLLRQIAAATKGADFNSAQLQDFRDLFGKRGDKLAAVFEEFDKAKDKPLITKEEVDRLDQANKKLEEFNRRKTIFEGTLASLFIETHTHEGFHNRIAELYAEAAKKNPPASKINENQYASPIGPPIRGRQLYPHIEPTSPAELDAMKGMLEIFSKVAEFNKIANRTKGTRRDKLLDIRRLIQSAEEIGTDGIVNSEQSGQLRLSAIAKLRGLREDISGPLRFDVNAAQQVGAKVSTPPGQSENNRLLNRLIAVERQLIAALQKTTGQAQDLGSYQ
jgi:hypothetical protein